VIRNILSALLIFWHLQTYAALIAYDCRDPLVNITAISLREVQPCPSPVDGYEAGQGFFQILEKKRFENIHVYSCLLEITRIISHCGAFSHTSMVNDAIAVYVHQVGAEECRKIHSFREYRGFSQTIIGKLEPNSSTTTTVDMAGEIDEKYNCQGTQYTENGSKWKNVVVQASVKITLRDFYTKISLESNEIKLPNGVVCPFLDGYCMDYVIGESTWNTAASQPCSDYNALYEGGATFVREKITNSSRNQYIVVEDRTKIFAIQLTKKNVLCGQTVWETEHPRLIVIQKESATQVTAWSMRQGDHPDADLITYVNTKFLYVEQSFKRSLNNMLANAVHRRCLLHREILKNRLLMAPVTPNAVATIIKSRLGYIARVSGEVLYIMKCVPIVVEIRRDENCYMELPVTAYNRSLFMSPGTHILQEHAQQIECNSIMPAMYYLEDKWIAFAPYLTTGITPQELRVDSEEQFSFQTIKSLGTGGIYTKSEIQRAQDDMMFSMERLALHNILIRTKMAGKELSRLYHSFFI